MTRRRFFAAIVGAGMTQPRPEGFDVSGHFTEACADDKHQYFSIQQTIAIMIDNDKAPTMVHGAKSLVGTTARLTLTRA